ncbi:MAG: Kelch repeat-containing protein [Nocardioides sp.]|nr:Kelch repeat-containing protein [Nocardioides sp.]
MRRILVAATVLVASACSAPHDAGAGAGSAPATPVQSQSASMSASPTTPREPPRLVVSTEPWRLPFPVAREAVVPDSGRFVVAGGLIAGDQSTSQVFTLDPATGHTRPAAPLGVPVHDTAGVSLHGRAVVIGGGNATEQNVVQTRTGGRWSTTGQLPRPRSDLTAVVVGRQALVLGGYDGSAVAVSSVLATRDGAHWRTVGRLPVPVRYAAGVARGHAVWLFGGERAGLMQTAVQRVDASGRARLVARLPRPLGHASALTLGGRILLVGGRTSSSSLTDRMWWFHPGSRSFTVAGRLPTPLADSAVGSDGDTAYLLGGETPSLSRQVVRLAIR